MTIESFRLASRHSVRDLKSSRKKSRKGASKKTSALDLRMRVNLIRKLSIVFVAGLLFSGVVLGVASLNPQEKLKKIANRPISNVQIVGDFLYFDKREAQDAVSSSVHGGFLDLDINLLKSRLESNPWVDRVAVARQWPDRVTVTIIEQQPIARWGSDGFLNKRGEIVRVPDAETLVRLPYLQGEEGDAETIMKQYLRIRKLFSVSELAVASLHLDPAQSWTVQLESGVVLKLGKEQPLEKLQGFLSATKTVLASKIDEVDAVDMRYHNGFSVSWKNKIDNQIALNQG